MIVLSLSNMSNNLISSDKLFFVNLGIVISDVPAFLARKTPD
jgi:hypothetical protein